MCLLPKDEDQNNISPTHSASNSARQHFCAEAESRRNPQRLSSHRLQAAHVEELAAPLQWAGSGDWVRKRQRAAGFGPPRTRKRPEAATSRPSSTSSGAPNICIEFLMCSKAACALCAKEGVQSCSSSAPKFSPLYNKAFSP